MKKTIAVGVLSVVLLSLLLSASVVTKAQSMADIDRLTMPTGDMAVRTPSKPMEMLSSADVQKLNAQMSEYFPKQESLLVNHATHFYYYENLDPIAKEIYDVIYGVAKDPVSQGNIGLMMTDMDPSSEEYYYEFNLAFRAICFDHPELFWLHSGEEAQVGYSSEAIIQNGFYFVYIMMAEPFLNFETQMTAFNQAAQEFLSDIDTNISEYSTIRQVHDKLLDLVNYNDPVAEQMISFSIGQDLAHTAYGALVTDSDGNPNYAVCDGYSLAFEYLLQQCGIETIFMAGMAGRSEDQTAGHAWNMVKMDGEWYEVDCTWDDSGSALDDLWPGMENYQYYLEALQDEEYKEKIDHYMFLVSTDRIRHFTPGDDYIYKTKDQMEEMQLVGESVHIRMEKKADSSALDPDPEVMALAPVAIQNYR